jgi:hypothetical protein
MLDPDHRSTTHEQRSAAQRHFCRVRSTDALGPERTLLGTDEDRLDTDHRVSHRAPDERAREG